MVDGFSNATTKYQLLCTLNKLNFVFKIKIDKTPHTHADIDGIPLAELR